MFTYAVGPGGETLREVALTRELGSRLCALKEAVYGRKIDRAMFEWHYFGHPRSAEMRVFVAEDAGQIIAATTRMPATFRADGVDCPAYFNIDSMVHPAHRRRGCMRDLYKLARATLPGDPLYFSKGSSAQIYPLLVSIGHRMLAPNTYLVSHPSTARWLMSRLHLVPSGGAREGRVVAGYEDFQPLERFGDDFDACFERAARGLAGVFVRDAAYMTWRYVDIPHRRYLRYRRVVDGVMCGVVILAIEEGQANVVDLLWDPARADEPDRTVRFAQALCDARRAYRVTCFATHPQLRDALTCAGFADRGETPRFSVHVSEAREALFDAAAERHVVDGDGDTEFFVKRATRDAGAAFSRRLLTPCAARATIDGVADPSIVQRLERQQERLHISIGAVCNNNCVFCMEEDREGRYVNNSAMTPDRVRWMLETHRGAEEVCFTSGEPTTRPELADFVTWARSLGYRRISVMTNGRRLSHLPYAAALAKAGMNRFYVSIHGHTKKLHEGLTRTPDSFEQTVAGLDSIAKLKRFGVELHTSTVITDRNAPEMLEIYRFLRAHGVDQVVFNVMQANGRANTFFEQIFPRYTEIAAHFRRFLDDVGEPRPPAFLVDIPLCTTEQIPDFNRGYVEKYRHFDVEERAVLPQASMDERRQSGRGKGLVLITRSDLDDAEREKRDACRSCKYDGQCEGVWKNYTRRYGWDEMAPVASPSPPALANAAE